MLVNDGWNQFLPPAASAARLPARASAAGPRAGAAGERALWSDRSRVAPRHVTMAVQAMPPDHGKNLEGFVHEPKKEMIC